MQVILRRVPESDQDSWCSVYKVYSVVLKHPDGIEKNQTLSYLKDLERRDCAKLMAVICEASNIHLKDYIHIPKKRLKVISNMAICEAKALRELPRMAFFCYEEKGWLILVHGFDKGKTQSKELRKASKLAELIRRLIKEGGINVEQ